MVAAASHPGCVLVFDFLTAPLEPQCFCSDGRRRGLQDGCVAFLVFVLCRYVKHSLALLCHFKEF